MTFFYVRNDKHSKAFKIDNPADIRCLKYPLSQTFIISNFLFVPFSSLGDCRYKFVPCLEPRYFKLSLCRTIFSVPSALLKTVFHPLSRTFSFYSFECWKNTFENFDRTLIFSYFNTTTCWSKTLGDKCQACKTYV